MKILVPLKRVADPDHVDRIQLAAGGDDLDPTGLEWTVNPFDHHALEAALRLTEDGRAPRQRLGEVVLVTLGPPEAEARLRSGLAIGADRAIRVEATDDALDGRLVALALARIVEKERPDLVVMGKQTVDGDTNQVGQRLGEELDWPVASFAVRIIEDETGLLIDRQLDGGTLRVRVVPPAIVTVDLAVVGRQAVRSRGTAAEFEYGEGVRFASLLAARQAQKRPIQEVPLAALVPDAALSVRRVGAGLARRRERGRRVEGVAELVERLATEARVL